MLQQCKRRCVCAPWAAPNSLVGQRIALGTGWCCADQRAHQCEASPLRPRAVLSTWERERSRERLCGARTGSVDPERRSSSCAHFDQGHAVLWHHQADNRAVWCASFRTQLACLHEFRFLRLTQNVRFAHLLPRSVGVGMCVVNPSECDIEKRFRETLQGDVDGEGFGSWNQLPCAKVGGDDLITCAVGCCKHGERARRCVAGHWRLHRN